jgi:hypothetical protein
MSQDFRELDPQQLSQVTGGGPIANWLAKRPLLRALLSELFGLGGGGGGKKGGGAPAGGDAAAGAGAGAAGAQQPAGGG